MFNRDRKPAWWQLYLLVPIMFGLLVVEHFVPLPRVSDQIVDGGIVVLTFGAMAGWVHANGGLLERYYMERDGTAHNLKITVYEPAATRRANRYLSHGPVGPVQADAYQAQAEPNEEVKEEETDEWLLN